MLLGFGPIIGVPRKSTERQTKVFGSAVTGRSAGIFISMVRYQVGYSCNCRVNSPEKVSVTTLSKETASPQNISPAHRAFPFHRKIKSSYCTVLLTKRQCHSTPVHVKLLVK